MSYKNSLRTKTLLIRKDFDIYKFHTENEIIIENVRKVLDSLYKDLNKESKKTVKLNYHEIEVLNLDSGLGMYLPLTGEPDLTKLMIRSKWTLSLPKIEGDQIKFVYYKIGDKLEKSKNGIRQPQTDTTLTPDIIIVPGLAYSIKGYRLGFGRGHYDKYFSKRKIKEAKTPIKIGVCFDEFLLEYVPNEGHDIKFDYIITNKTILKL